MDASPVAQLIAHARGAQAAHTAAQVAARQVAAAAEADRPSKRPGGGQQATSASK
jgi:hypothetical protein